WYRAELHGEHVGAYAVRASVTTDDGRHLHGSGSFEVAAPVGNSPSPVSWQPIGPNADGGPIATTSADPDVAAITQYTKAGPWTAEPPAPSPTSPLRRPCGTRSTAARAASSTFSSTRRIRAASSGPTTAARPGAFWISRTSVCFSGSATRARRRSSR